MWQRSQLYHNNLNSLRAPLECLAVSESTGCGTVHYEQSKPHRTNGNDIRMD